MGLVRINVGEMDEGVWERTGTVLEKRRRRRRCEHWGMGVGGVHRGREEGRNVLGRTGEIEEEEEEGEKGREDVGVAERESS